MDGRSPRIFICPAPRAIGAAARQSRGRLVIDFTHRGKPIGIEITAPTKATLAAVNRALKEFGFPPVKPRRLAPLRAA